MCHEMVQKQDRSGYLDISVLERCDDVLDQAFLRNRPGLHPHALLLHPESILQYKISEGTKLEEGGGKGNRRERQVGIRAAGTCEVLAEQTWATKVAPRKLRARQGGEAINDCVLAVDPEEGKE